MSESWSGENFNTSHVSINQICPEISSIVLGNFNTSHVSINLYNCGYTTIFLQHFNTSHVSINHTKNLFKTINKWYFNTSHVSINRGTDFKESKTKITISIHLMFLLIFIRPCVPRLSFVISIHLMFLLIGIKQQTQDIIKKFQYISCFY